MKKNLFTLVLSLLVLLPITGCKDKNNNPETLAGSVERPVWTAPEDYDKTSTMSVVAKVDLKIQYPELAADYALNSQDLLAAFAGDKCLGIASPTDGLFHLMVTSTEGSFTLRYYSAQYRNLFTTDPIVFQTDARLGTPDHPYTPKLALMQ